MARKPKSTNRASADQSPPPAPPETVADPVSERVPDLGLEHFATPSDDAGLSLEELSEAYASLLSDGADPYSPVPNVGEDGLGGLAADGEIDADEEAVGEELSSVAGDESAVEEDDTRLPAAAEVEISPRTILEAMLFVGHPAHEPLTAKHVSSLMRGVRPREVDELVQELNDVYAAENCPYAIESVGAGYRLGLRTELEPLRDRFYGRVKEARLSQQAIDVLALVAYNQPLTRPEIEKLRNAASGGVLSQLVRRGLLRVERPDRKPREPIFYTTDRFLELFGLETLEDLPKSQD
jgi:segregation and condensation protein B